MATAKSLTAAELDKVLSYTAAQPYAQRNRAMLLMTVAAGLRVSEVAGLTLGDVLDSTGAVRGEVYLAAHRVKHARPHYLHKQQTTAGVSRLHFYTHQQGPIAAFVSNTSRTTLLVFTQHTRTALLLGVSQCWR